MIECFSDCPSPWIWLAFCKLRALSVELDLAVHWKPLLVGGLFNAVNPSVYALRDNGAPAKQAYRCKDLMGWARHDAVTILFSPSVFQSTVSRRCGPAAGPRIRAGWRRLPDRCFTSTGPATATSPRADCRPTLFVGGDDMYFGRDRLPLVREAVL